MKVSKRERDIFIAAHMNADISVAQIARRCGYRDHIVRRAIESMKENEILRTELLIDEARLGLQNYFMLFNLSPGPKVSVAELENALNVDPVISYLARVTGDYRHAAAFYVQDFSEIGQLIDRITNRFGQVFSRKLLSLRAGWTFLGSKYLLPDWKPKRYLQTGYNTSSPQLSPTDLILIDKLNIAPLQSIAELAKEIGLPQTTVNFRVNRLKKLNIIGNPINRMPPSVSGMYAFFAFIRTRAPSLRFENSLLQYAISHPNIVEFYRTTGGWDYELLIEAEDPSVMHQTTQELETHFREQIESIVQLSRLKDLKWVTDYRSLLKQKVAHVAEQ